MKTELKNIHRIKSYGQNKIGCQILAISFVFLPLLKPKRAIPVGIVPDNLESWNIFGYLIWPILLKNGWARIFELQKSLSWREKFVCRALMNSNNRVQPNLSWGLSCKLWNIKNLEHMLVDPVDNHCTTFSFFSLSGGQIKYWDGGNVYL